MPTLMDVLRTLAVFADIGDKRHFNEDSNIVTEWTILDGSKTITARLTLADVRAARNFIKKVEESKKKDLKTETIRMAAFGEP